MRHLAQQPCVDVGVARRWLWRLRTACRCTVPKLKGKRLAAARRAIKAHDCSVGKVERALSTTITKGRVISQKPKPHRLLTHGAKVNLTVSKGKRPARA